MMLLTRRQGPAMGAIKDKGESFGYEGTESEDFSEDRSGGLQKETQQRREVQGKTEWQGNRNHIDLGDTDNKPPSPESELDRRQVKSRPQQKRLHRCRLCPYSSSRAYCVTIHERTHTGEKPFNCHVCQKAFTRNYGLQRHIRTHTGERPYRCEVCRKAFPQSSDLVRHNRMHTGETPYRCSKCGSMFQDPSNFAHHKTIHEAV